MSKRRTSTYDAVIIDGCALLWNIHWPATGTVEQYIKNLIARLNDYLKRCCVYLIFDRYLTRSTKSATRSNRAGMNVSRRHVLKLQTPLPSKDVVLKVTHNKTQLIKLIVQYLLDHLEDNDNELVITSKEPVPIVLRNGKISKRDALYNVHEEADVIIVNQLVYLADQGARNILVVCDDTDVFMLLIYFYCGKDLSCGVIMESPVPGRTVVDIKTTADKHKHIVEHLPGVHALSGCDTSYFFRYWQSYSFESFE